MKHLLKRKKRQARVTRSNPISNTSVLYFIHCYIIKRTKDVKNPLRTQKTLLSHVFNCHFTTFDVVKIKVSNSVAQNQISQCVSQDFWSYLQFKLNLGRENMTQGWKTRDKYTLTTKNKTIVSPALDETHLDLKPNQFMASFILYPTWECGFGVHAAFTDPDLEIMLGGMNVIRSAFKNLPRTFALSFNGRKK